MNSGHECQKYNSEIDWAVTTTNNDGDREQYHYHRVKNSRNINPHKLRWRITFKANNDKSNDRSKYDNSTPFRTKRSIQPKFKCFPHD